MTTNPFEAQPNLDSDLQSIDVDPAVIASKFTGLVSYENVMILPRTVPSCQKARQFKPLQDMEPAIGLVLLVSTPVLQPVPISRIF